MRFNQRFPSAVFMTTFPSNKIISFFRVSFKILKRPFDIISHKFYFYCCAFLLKHRKLKRKHRNKKIWKINIEIWQRTWISNLDFNEFWHFWCDLKCSFYWSNFGSCGDFRNFNETSSKIFFEKLNENLTKLFGNSLNPCIDIQKVLKSMNFLTL